MASEPSSSRDVGKRISNVSIAVMVLMRLLKVRHASSPSLNIRCLPCQWVTFPYYGGKHHTRARMLVPNTEEAMTLKFARLGTAGNEQPAVIAQDAQGAE